MVRRQGDGSVAISLVVTGGGDSSCCDVKGGTGSGATGFDSPHPFAEVIFRGEKVRTRSTRARCQQQS